MHSLDKLMMGEMKELVRTLMDEDKKQQLAQLAGKK
jgi:protein subunit release factor A